MVGNFHSISFCAVEGAASSAALTAGESFSISKLLPRSMPIFLIRAIMGSSVRWGRFTLRSSAA
jgi:hypothetical protein